jgi:acyl-CoA-binding protein
MKDVEYKFQKAYEITSSMKEKLPPDTMLKLYAYYKHATRGVQFARPSGENNVRNAFKLNAIFQLNDITEEEAKKQYIKLVEAIIQHKIK